MVHCGTGLLLRAEWKAGEPLLYRDEKNDVLKSLLKPRPPDGPRYFPSR